MVEKLIFCIFRLLCIKFLEVIFSVCLYDVHWASLYVHVIAEKSFLFYFVLAISF